MKPVAFAFTGILACISILSGCSSIRRQSAPPSSPLVAALSSDSVDVRKNTIRQIYDAAQSSPPSPEISAALFNTIRHDPDWQIKVRAIAVMPLLRERDQAIQVLIDATHDRDPQSSGSGNVPSYAISNLMKMHAPQTRAAAQDWLDYLQNQHPYNPQIQEIMLSAAKAKLSLIDRAKN